MMSQITGRCCMMSCDDVLALGEVLVFYLSICFFYYLAKLVIFIRSSRIPCIFFMKGDSRAFI